MSEINAGDAEVGGTAAGLSRRDHQHAVNTGVAVDIGTANAEGTSTDLARADHVHKMSQDAIDAVLGSKQFAFGLETFRFTTTASTSDSNNALTKKIVDASTSKMVGGTSSADGLVTTGVDNKVSIRDSDTNDPIETASNEQIYGRLTASGSGALSGTWTWDGTTTVLSDDTSGVAVGNFIRNATDMQLFEITSITPNVSVTISNPGSLIIPTASGAEEVALTLSYYYEAETTDVETAYAFAGATDIDTAVRESMSVSSAPFNALQSGVAFSEILPASHSHTLVDITDVTASAAEVNVLDGFTGTTAELNEITNGSDVIAATHHHDSRYINISELTTAGDILYHNGTTVVRLPVGADNQVLTVDTALGGKLAWENTAATDTEVQEAIATQTITGTDTALTATLTFTPKSNASVVLFLNGVQQRQGVGKDYTISGTTITWLASSGSAVDMETTDDLDAVYVA